MKKILIAGATGFLGTALKDYFQEKGIQVISLSRKHENHKPHSITWSDLESGKDRIALDSCDAWINLAGKSVDCRYTEKNKNQIINSRVNSTRVLNEALEKVKNKPEVFLNASTATIYEHSESLGNTEKDGIIGDDFSMNVAKSWEEEFFSHLTPETRKVALRTSIVLGNAGGAFPKLRKITVAGLGGKQGSGNQMVSWIHISDFCRAVEFLINSTLEGPVNVTLPQPLSNEEFTKILAEKMNKTIAIPQPVWLLKIGAAIIGTETELLLKSRYVIPERLEKAGFKWEFPTVNKCFEDLLCTD